MTAKKRRKSEQPSPDINVTPLVDVVLVLLIIFMVMMPALNEGAAVELPKVMSVEPEPELEPLNVTFAYSGRVIVDKREIERSELTAKLKDHYAADPERTLLLKFDERFPYEKARSVFKEIQDVGFGGISLKVNERKKPGEGK